jgi:hypothetical protein
MADTALAHDALLTVLVHSIDVTRCSRHRRAVAAYTTVANPVEDRLLTLIDHVHRAGRSLEPEDINLSSSMYSLRAGWPDTHRPDGVLRHPPRVLGNRRRKAHAEEVEG